MRLVAIVTRKDRVMDCDQFTRMDFHPACCTIGSTRVGGSGERAQGPKSTAGP